MESNAVQKDDAPRQDVITRDERQVVTVQQGPTMLEIFAKAMEKGVMDVERMREFREMVAWDDARNAKRAFHAAFAGFRGEAVEIIKAKRVFYPHNDGQGSTEYWHETLDMAVDAAVPALSKWGLSHHWVTEQAQGGVITVTCFLTHKLGYSISTSLWASPDTSGKKNPIQSVGSTVHYLERYTFLAVTGLAAKGVDDDGAGSAPRSNGNADATPVAITSSQVKELDKLIKATGTDLSSFLDWAKCGSLAALPPAEFKSAHDMLLKRKALQDEKAKAVKEGGAEK